MRLTRNLTGSATGSLAWAFLLSSTCMAFGGEDPDLLARWRLDRPHFRKGVFAPLAGATSATVVGPARFARSPQPPALLLDGNTAQRHRLVVAKDITKAHHLLPSQAITVEAWFRIDKANEWGGIVSALQDNGNFEKGWFLGNHHSRFLFALATRGRGRLEYLESRTLFEPGHWYHVVGTYDGKHQRLFVDGQLQGDSSASSGPIDYPPTGVITLGAYEDDNEFYPLNGALEQVSLWKRALTAPQIQQRFLQRNRRFPGVRPVRPTVVDWPTWMRDNQRTGFTDQALQFPLHLHWVYESRRPPSPAWPEPAQQDFWHRKHDLKARVTYDRAFHLVAAHDRVLFGSSSEDSVRCLKASTGALLWEFSTEGPVRLAPTIAGKRVLFGSDDGHVYCLQLATGRLLWKQHVAPDVRRIAGNERIISAWPVRAGVLVEQGIAYCCAGLFPTQGVHQVAFDISTGKRLAGNTIGVSAQGYLSRRSGRLFVTTGRDPAGAFVTALKRRGKGIGRELSNLPEEFRYAFIGAGPVRLGGARGRVAAFHSEDGRQVWSAPVRGKAWSMAVAAGRLLVSTDAGHIYAFASSTVTRPIRHAAPSPPPPRQHHALLENCLKQLAPPRGYALVLGCPDTTLPLALAQHSHLQVVIATTDKSQASRTHHQIRAAGMAGRVTAHHVSSLKKLPYVASLFNLVVLVPPSAPEARPLLPKADLIKLARPWGGLVVTGPETAQCLRRGPLAGAGEWSHMYADPSNTVCSDDRHVSGPLILQWFGRPGPQQMLDRHHRTVAPLFKAGRLFVPGNDRVIAADAYNGTQLWNRALPGSRRIGAFRDCSYLAATDDSLYVAAGDRCLRLDGPTGKTLATFPLPRAADGQPRDWGYLACVDNILVGSAVKPGASRRDHSRDAILEGTYHDNRPLVGSEFLFALDRTTGRHLWSYHSGAGLLPNPTLSIHGDSVTFVESNNAKTLQEKQGRATPAELFKNGAHLISLDLRSGSIRWSRKQDFSAIQHSIYVSAAKGRIAVVGSRNNGKDKKTARVCYDIHVFDADTGDRRWFQTQTQTTGIGGDHGEQDHHPVIIGNTLYCEPFAWDLNSGQPVKDFAWRNKHRRGCGTITASASTIFFRDSSASMFDLDSNTYGRVTTTTRPGCWINMIPAGGLLLVPEASSGCTCNFAIQTSLAFRPLGR